MDKEYLKKTLRIVLPVTLVSMLNMLTNMVDTLMIGRLGENSIAAVGLANKVFFVFILLVFGVSSGMSVLSAQYWGKKDVRRIREVLGMALSVGMTGGVLIALVCLLAPAAVMRIFANDPAMIAEGVLYLRIACLSYPLAAITNVFIASMRSMGEVRVPIFTSIGSIVINVFFNYILIFGKLGCPAMGVRGAALATLIARFAEMGILLLILKHRHSPLVSAPGELFAWEKGVFEQFRKDSLPVVLNEILWSLGVATYSLTYGRMGVGAAAAMTIVGTFQDIEVVGTQGLASATAILLGNELGAGKLKEAERHARLDLIYALVGGVAFALLTVLAAKPFIRLFEVTPEVGADIFKCLLIFAPLLMVRFINNIVIVGILRAGGDTFVCMLIDILPVWLVASPLVYLSGLVWKLPIHIVFIFANADELTKFLIGLFRYRQKKWLKNLNAELTQISAK